MADRKTPLLAEKAMRYGTRRLVADEPFDAKGRDARLLVAIGKARYATEDARAGEAAPVLAKDELVALRAAYQTKFGKRAFNGWDAATLRTKIAGA